MEASIATRNRSTLPKIGDNMAATLNGSRLNAMSMRAVVRMTPTRRHERRIDSRTACAIAANGPRPSHQNAGSATTNSATGHSRGTAAKISASGGSAASSTGTTMSIASG